MVGAQRLRQFLDWWFWRQWDNRLRDETTRQTDRGTTDREMRH